MNTTNWPRSNAYFQGNLIAGTLFGFSKFLLARSSIQGFKSRCGPRAQVLEEIVPVGQVDESTPLESSDSDTVSANGTP